MLTFRHHGRMLASTGLAAAIALPGFVGALPPSADPVLSSGPGASVVPSSAKVSDRMPGFEPVAHPLSAAHTPIAWPLSATLQMGVAFAVAPEPTQVASAATGPTRDRPARSASRAQRIGPVLAQLPPSRPAALLTSGGLTAGAKPREPRPSIVARMASFVGSLATLDAFL